MTVALLGPREDPGPVVRSAGALLREFRPIETIVDGLPIGRGMLTCITAPTGHGKTTITALLEVALVCGRTFAGREVTRGSVLVLAGENPDDYLMHLAATLQDAGLDTDAIGREKGYLLVVPGVFDLDVDLDRLRTGCSGAELVAVIVDTSAAFFAGEDENGNVAMRDHARRLRELTNLPGRPGVIVLCHPTKSASSGENLLPRGGGAFLNEVDANLTLWKDAAGIVSLHWAGKIRGSHFEPVRFELAALQLEGRVDCRGKPVWSSVARHVQDARAEQIERRELSAQDRLLEALRKFPGESISELAHASGLVSSAGEPQKSTVTRMLAELERHRLAVKDHRAKWSLTPKGQEIAEALP